MIEGIRTTKQGLERVYRMDNIKKNFGFGCMRLPMNGESVNLEETGRMVDAFWRRASTFTSIRRTAIFRARAKRRSRPA